MDKNHPLVKQQIKRAHIKSILFASIITGLFVVTFTFSPLHFFWFIFGFLVSRGIAFAWFARRAWKYLEPYEPHQSDPTIDGVNMNNGYPPGSDFIIPPPLSRQ